MTHRTIAYFLKGGWEHSVKVHSPWRSPLIPLIKGEIGLFLAPLLKGGWGDRLLASLLKGGWGELLWRGMSGLVGLFLALLLAAQPCLAQTSSLQPETAAQKGLTDPQELAAFLDGFFARQMAELHIPGAVFALVKDDKIFFTKGYGYADLQRKIPIIPDKTLFNLGSLSKLFTATAVMQLAEKGQLKLKDNINQYLQQFQLEENYPAPVTFDNLLTHTGGFDERFIGMAAQKCSEVQPLGEYLAARMPPRVMPPGETISYSNHGLALAGYLVETISGKPFTQYVDENLLQPLQMHKSSFLEPLPPDLAGDLAVGYQYRRDRYQQVPPYFINTIPSGGLKATATDMAHFAIAHLQNGRYGNVEILSPGTIKQMHAAHFTHHPRLPGWTYGFSERFQNQQRAIQHTGTNPGFASLLFLLPEQHLGFFVAYNRDQNELRERLISQFLDRYYPVQNQPLQHRSPQPPLKRGARRDLFRSPELPLKRGARRNLFQKRSDRFVGNYRYMRYSRRSLEKLSTVLLGAPQSAPEVRIRTRKDGIVLEPNTYQHNRSAPRALQQPLLALFSHATSVSPTPNQLVEIEPLVFQWLNGEGAPVAFRMDSQGRIAHLFIGTDAFEKLSWYETIRFQLSLFGICILVFFSNCLIWLFRYYRGAKCWARSPCLFSSTLCISLSTLNLAFLVGLVLALSLGNLYAFAFSVPTAIVILLNLPILSTGLTVTLTCFTILMWKSKYWSTQERLQYIPTILSGWGFTFFLSYWNILGFHF